jgi:hypothetical protein
MLTIRHSTKSQESSSPGESHPQALTESDVTVSRHPALIVQPFLLNNHLLEVGGFKARGLKVQQYRQANAAG